MLDKERIGYVGHKKQNENKSKHKYNNQKEEQHRSHQAKWGEHIYSVMVSYSCLI